MAAVSRLGHAKTGRTTAAVMEQIATGKPYRWPLSIRSSEPCTCCFSRLWRCLICSSARAGNRLPDPGGHCSHFSNTRGGGYGPRYADSSVSFWNITDDPSGSALSKTSRISGGKSLNISGRSSEKTVFSESSDRSSFSSLTLGFASAGAAFLGSSVPMTGEFV